MDEVQTAAREFLRRALDASGKSAYKLAKDAGISSTTITRPLNNPEYKFTSKLETLSKIARAAGIEVPEILNRPESMDLFPVASSIPVLGEVRAGAWTSIPDDFEPEEWLHMEVPDYAGAKLFALRVVGRSMDLLYPDGSYVIVVSPVEAGVRVGDKVAVRRRDGAGKVETTLKEVVRLPSGELMLQPRSSDTSLEAIPLVVNRDDQAQEGVEIIGVVVAKHANEKRGTGPLLSL